MAKAITLDPRNEQYRFNLATIYLANHQLDKAKSVLETLRGASTPEIAASAATALRNMQQVEQAQANPTLLPLIRRGDPERPGSSDTNTTSAKSESTKWGAPIFIHGILSEVDCSTEPAAQLTVTSGSKKLNLKVADKNHVIVMGADHFSCSWSNQKVAVNYRQNDSGETNVMSVELQ
jgi:hypothetical protein